jgi:glycosyltransferase involved in cell wall biosynthesis
MRVGTICFATQQGIGILAKQFYDNGVITDPLIVRHGRRHTHDEWYPENTPQICTFPIKKAPIVNWIKSVDVMLLIETAFDWDLVTMCHEYGKKVVLIPMYECTPTYAQSKVDGVVAPSLLDKDYYPGSTYLPIPVPDGLWKQRTIAKRFLHNAGHLGLRHNKGTLELMQAMKHVKSNVELLIRTQEERGLANLMRQVPEIKEDPRVSFHLGEVGYNDLFDGYDVYVAPEKLSALCLPLAEAFASGMYVIATNRYSQNQWLPQEGLFLHHAEQMTKLGNNLNSVPIAAIRPIDIANKIDSVFNTDISEYSLAGKDFASRMSWEVLRPLWLNELGKYV